MGTTVSFQGGRPWRETVREMLIPAGLVMREKGQTIAIGYKTDTTASTLDCIPLRLLQRNTLSMAPAVTVFPQAVVASHPAPPANLSTSDNWTGERGDSLHKVLDGWCRRARVELDWLSEYDYPLEASVTYKGTFEDAVRTMLVGFEDAHPQPIAELH